MFIRSFIIMISCLLFSSQALAFDCYFTLLKDSCWTNYNVTVTVADGVTGDKLITLTVPKDKSWERKKFTCKAGQILQYTAQFSPVFWQNQQDKVYPAKHNLYLPKTIDKTKEIAWNLPVCFGREFAGIPFPPDAEGSCKCDFTTIPPIQKNGS